MTRKNPADGEYLKEVVTRARFAELRSKAVSRPSWIESGDFGDRSAMQTKMW